MKAKDKTRNTLLLYSLLNNILLGMRYHRGFRIPLGPLVIPPIGALLCLLLMITSSKETGIRLVLWLGIGQIIYFTYGFWHSKLRYPQQIDPAVVMGNLPIENG